MADHRDAKDWPEGCIALVGPGADETVIRTAWTQLAEASGGVWRLTVQPVVPHVEVHFRPPQSESSRADALLTPIRDLGATLSGR
jgi:hypothetical protein